MSKLPVLTGNINNNNAELLTAFENTLSRDGSLPNTMEADLDMNSNRILNSPDPTDPTHLVTLQYGNANYGSGAIAAAAGSAAAALASEVAAAASALAAAASAAQLIGTSTTGVTIGAGAQTFTTQAGKFFAPGTNVIITSDANPTVDFMFGTTTSYSGTALDVNVLAFGGAGLHSDWTIRVSGARGAQGPAGAAGAGTGDMLGANNLSDVANAAASRANLGLGSAALQAITFFLQTANNLSDLANAAAARGNLGLGTMATQNSNNVAITGGSITGVSGLTNPVVTTGANGKIVMGNATVQWGTGNSTLAGNTINFPTAFSAPPFFVTFMTTDGDITFRNVNSITATNFIAKQSTTASQPMRWFALGPT